MEEKPRNQLKLWIYIKSAIKKFKGFIILIAEISRETHHQGAA